MNPTPQYDWRRYIPYVITVEEESHLMTIVQFVPCPYCNARSAVYTDRQKFFIKCNICGTWQYLAYDDIPEALEQWYNESGYRKYPLAEIVIVAHEHAA